MEMKRLVFLISARVIPAVMLMLALTAFTAVAQDSGAVSGVVVSSWDGTPLAGATVTVRGTTLAGQTDSAGRFELKNLPPGDQVLRISKSGYAAAVVTDVRIIAGQTTTMNGNLRPEFFEMEEYEVTAEEFTQQTEQIIIERQQSSGMMDAMGSEQFSKLGAGDAAEALSKVSGASIADGKFAVIRGLADRYTATTLNGTDLPSADPDRKAAQLDLLPTHIIQQMDVAKTFSPDMGGGFAGGAINIVTKSYPDKGMVSFSLGTAYNTQASLNKNFLASDRGSKDWLAMDDGKRELPAAAASTPAFGTGAPVNNESVVERSFGSSQIVPVRTQAPLNSSLSVTAGDSLKRDWFKLGYLGSFNYKNDYKFYDDGFVRSFGGQTDKVDAKGVSEYTWSTSASLTLGLGDNHELKYNFIFIQSAEDEAQQLKGLQADIDGTFYQNILRWTERNLTYHQLAGHHEFPELAEVQVDWGASMATATQNEPDSRVYSYVIEESIPGEYRPLAPGAPSYPTRSWRDIEENNHNVRADVTVPMPSYNDKDNFLKTGAALSESTRDFFQRGFSMRNPGSLTGNPADFLAPQNYGQVTYYNYPINTTYQGEQTITAGYLLADWYSLSWLRLVGGARIEQTELLLNGFNTTLNQRILPGKLNQTDLLPSLSGTFFLRDTLQLRAAWSQTVVRPTYREFSDVFVYEPTTARSILGNPRLVIADSQNYDLRMEWFPRRGEIVSLSVFMKQIGSPIELRQVDSGTYQYVNSTKADVYGVEFEFRTRLDNFWDPLEELTMGLNAAYIVSEVPINATDRGSRRQYSGNTDSKRPLFDQPEYVANADLTWDHAETGTSCTLSAGVVGRRLVSYGIFSADEYEEPAPQLDFFVSQKIGKNWKIKFSAKNLLDPAYEVTQTYEAPIGNGEPFATKSYTKGMTFGLSVGCEF